MANMASELVGRLKEKWGAAGPAGRWLVVGLSVALAMAVGLGLYLNRPDWVVLVNQADPKDAASVVARLQELKVPYRQSGDGYTISVSKQDQYTAKLALAQAGLPKGPSVGMELFDEPKFGATEFDRKVNLLRAQQGELERALLRISELEYVNVKLALPERSVFIRDQFPVRASVLVQPRAGRKLSPEQIIGIVNFMSGAVQGLSTENVTLVDQTGRLLSNGASELAAAQGLDSEQVTRQEQLQKEMERRVQTLLEPIFGPGNVVARVNLELNMDARRIETQTVGSATPKSTETVREASKGATPSEGSAIRPAEPGAPPVYQGQSASEGDDKWKSSTRTDYEVSNHKETTVIAPGAVKRISVGIAINRSDLSPVQINQIKDSVAGATGADASAISVAAMLFNRETETAAPAAAQPVQPLHLALGLVSAAVLMLAGFFVTRRRQEEESLVPAGLLSELPRSEGVGTTLDVALGLPGQPQQRGILSSLPPESFGGSMKPEPDQDREKSNEPASDKDTQNRLEIVLAPRPRRQIVLDEQPVDEDMLSLIDDLITHNPETCAALVREWLKGGAA